MMRPDLPAFIGEMTCPLHQRQPLVITEDDQIELKVCCPEFGEECISVFEKLRYNYNIVLDSID